MQGRLYCDSESDRRCSTVLSGERAAPLQGQTVDGEEHPSDRGCVGPTKGCSTRLSLKEQRRYACAHLQEKRHLPRQVCRTDAIVHDSLGAPKWPNAHISPQLQDARIHLQAILLFLPPITSSAHCSVLPNHSAHSEVQNAVTARDSVKTYTQMS